MTTARRRSATVALGVTALLAAGLAGCSSDGGRGGDATAEDADYEAVCVDDASQQRIDDEYCDDRATRYHGSGAAAWYFLARGAAFPRIGGRVTGGTFRNPGAGRTVQQGGAPVGGGTAGTGSGGDGGSVSRGGFGGSHSSGS
jgi:hypothetical protein